jgi:hypothetical protein
MRAYLFAGMSGLFLLACLAPAVQASDDPSAPQDLTIDSLGSAILVSWQPPLVGEVSSYLVERLTSAGLSPPVQVDASTTQFVDAMDATTTAGAAYQVTAVHVDGSRATTAAAAIFGAILPGTQDCDVRVIISMEITIDGPCFIYAATEPIPDETLRSDVRELMLGAWYNLDGLIDFIKSIIQGAPETGMGVNP